MKNTITLKVRGLHTPRILIWIFGFIHGKILRTGGLDPETGIISSAYVCGQINRFCKACVDRRDRAKEKLKKEWDAADDALHDYKAVSDALADIKAKTPSYENSSAEARANEVAVKRRVDCEKELLTLRKRLSGISNAICAEIGNAHDQIEATSHLLLSAFACYGHGMIMRPLFPNNLPAVPLGDPRSEILNGREHTWNAIRSILNLEK